MSASAEFSTATSGSPGPTSRPALSTDAAVAPSGDLSEHARLSHGIQESPAVDTAFAASDRQALRAANLEAAAQAAASGQRFLASQEYERAVRLLKRSFALAPLPATAALLDRALAGLRADARYCGACHRFRSNCVCPPQAQRHPPRLPQAGAHPGGRTIFAPIQAALVTVLSYVRFAHAAIRAFLLQSVRVAPSRADALAGIICLAPALALLRAIVGQPLLPWLLRPSGFAYTNSGGGGSGGGSGSGNGSFSVYVGGFMPLLWLGLGVQMIASAWARAGSGGGGGAG